MKHDEKLKRALEINRKINQNKVISDIAAKQMIRADELTDEEKDELVGLYPNYAVDRAYIVGDIINYNGTLYEVIQSHTSQADWKPNEVPALYKKIVPEGVIPEWVEPTGAHDAYMQGDKVIYNGKVYVSVIDNNTWSPTAYPQGWELVE